jgi:hypothetical protein
MTEQDQDQEKEKDQEQAHMNNYDPYILNETNMQNYLKCKINDTIHAIKNNKINNKIKNDIKPSVFFPREHDTLFWCYYIILNGEFKYDTLHVKNSVIEKQMKIDLVSKIRENKPIVKMYKLDTITSLENNLANDNNINIKTVITLCAIENINIVFVSKKTYFELLLNDTNPIYVIRETELNTKYNKKYGFEIADAIMLENIRNTLYKLDILDKPIKSLSSYKVSDLINISTKLAIEIINKENGKKLSKNELYESIVQYF